jgi:acylphosphatase
MLHVDLGRGLISRFLGMGSRVERRDRYNLSFLRLRHYRLRRGKRMRVARRLVVSGRVQGVGFRYFTQEAAAREGVTGWVRNLPDGRVEAHVEGERDAVTCVERAIRRGPRGARVDSVEVDVEEPGGVYRGFGIE